MKTLTKKNGKQPQEKTAKTPQAQCCAKQSTSPQGCHD
jgi:hypothetical protein